MKTLEKVYATLPTNGWLSYPEAELLYAAAQQTEGPILEVGCYYGRSTVLLASLGRLVVTVDPFENFDSDDPSGGSVHNAFLSNLLAREISNVFLCPQSIETWISSCTYQFAYLDGDHTYQGTINQIQVALCAGVRSMCLHDYAKSGGGVEIAKAIMDSPIKMVNLVERMAHCVHEDESDEDYLLGGCP